MHHRAAGPGQAVMVASPHEGVDASRATLAAYAAIARVLQDQGLTIVHERLFGSLSVRPEIMVSRAEALNSCGIDSDGSLTYIQGQPPWGKGLAGIIIQAVTGNTVWTIQDQGKAVGRGWQQGGATFLLLQNLQGLAGNGEAPKDRPHQIRGLIHQAARLLEAQGASYRDVVRTWFYLDDILAWYPEFQPGPHRHLWAIRPASRKWPLAVTGQHRHSRPGALGSRRHPRSVGGGGPPEGRPLVKQLRSPAQPEALRYGSAFSRGALIRHPEVSLIQVSGTAAIDEQGTSLYPGDIRGQIDCTLDKIAALLGPEGARLTDTAAACVFLKSPQDALIYQEQAAARGLGDFPAVVMVADICREELLFEIDAEVAFNPVSR